MISKNPEFFFSFFSGLSFFNHFPDNENGTQQDKPTNQIKHTQTPLELVAIVNRCQGSPEHKTPLEMALI